MTLYEIFTLGDVPFPNDSWDGDFMARIEEGTRMNKPKHALQEM
jgi:hypothetical protein